MKKVDVVIDLLPAQFCTDIAKLAVKNGVHLVNTFYTNKEISQLHSEAETKGLTILPEFGFDPGIDLVLCNQGIRELDEVDELYSYGGGIPEPQSADNPLKYKISWTFAGVLKSYQRAGRLIQNGNVKDIKANEQFTTENTHTLNIKGVGQLEAFPNGDAVRYAEILGIRDKLKNAGRFALRWSGHCEFWKKLVDLHFLDEKSITVDSISITPQKFLCSLLEPQLQYKEQERDMAILRVDIRGIKEGKRKQIIYQLIDYRDLETGLMAMNRTVGYTASIGAQMILRGDIKKRGVISPVKDIPGKRFFDELKKRNIEIKRKVIIIK